MQQQQKWNKSLVKAEQAELAKATGIAILKTEEVSLKVFNTRKPDLLSLRESWGL